MYAITPTGYRAITRREDVGPGEVFAETLPDSLVDYIAATGVSHGANAETMRTQAELAITNMRAYRDLASPTNAQTIAAVKLLCRVAISLIRLQLAKLDATD